MISTTPYLIRAIYDWCGDQGFTPHMLVDASIDGVVVPRQLVENDSIVLNIQPTAVRSMDMGNEWIMFNARFSGKPMEVAVPVNAVRAIFARENGLGCAFEASSDTIPDELKPIREELSAPLKKDKKQKNSKGSIKPKNKKDQDKKSHLKLV